MNLNTGFFPAYGHRRKQTTAAYHLPLNNQQHHHALSVHSARSSIESVNGNESFLPSIPTAIINNDGHKPYRRNDFANNHLFIAKRKLARLFLGQPSRNLQASSDLIHLFDQQTPKRKKQNINKPKLPDTASNKTPPDEQDSHLSVVNLVMKPPYPSKQPHEPLSLMLRHRYSQAIQFPPKVPRSSIDTTNSTVKQTSQSNSFHTFTDNNEFDDLIENDNLSDAISSTIQPFDSSILCVKSIIPSAVPQHTNHHLLHHR